MSENPYSAPYGTLLAAAGCEPISSSYDRDSWLIVFRSPDGEEVRLDGKCRFDDFVKGERDRSLAVLSWCKDRGIRVGPDSIVAARTQEELRLLRWTVEHHSRVLEGVSAAVVALRLASTDKTCIKVWRFYDAPPELRALSGHGGDEDWLALLPPGFDPPAWMEDGTGFGICAVSAHDLPDGWAMRIGAHS